ncbi:unnamed protein product [Adineta steineri]|uniref:cellulase n=1 Tax=Adineta steineri TaxID=433720 RepID=A0A818XNE4_9BILA|nr:unnamed protein product [Adineta steineri]CAF3743208.1 unnamed protein product [Adineta steineri]CAF3841268.1 unnamed protein product [Adineta steineri]
MLRSIYLPLILLILITSGSTTLIGCINSAAYAPANFSNVLIYNGTCSQCICAAFFSNTPATYQALNCYENNQTCSLFPSFLSQSNVHINTNSKLYFMPQKTTTTTITTIITTTTTTTTGTTTTTTTTTGILSTTTYFNDSRQNASTSTYWDCCKLSCGWPGKANVTSPPRTCTQNGNTTIDSNTQSVCVSGGSAYMCTDQQPWNISGNLSYGYAGAYVYGLAEKDWCCTCYSLLFTSGPIIGKEMIIQVINTAYTADNMFILQIPGGGWGGSSNGCASQFNSSYTFGNQYGGITSRTNCSSLPSVLQAGCYWRFDWFMNAYNPSARFKIVSCPTSLTSKTGCVRLGSI